MSNGFAGGNTALLDEIHALNSIYGDETIVIPETTASSMEQGLSTLSLKSMQRTKHTQNDPGSNVIATLQIPNTSFSFQISFPVEYPDAKPRIVKIQSTGPGVGSNKGQGEGAVRKLKEILDRIWVDGQVCMFDLIEEASPVLSTGDDDHIDEENSVAQYEEEDNLQHDSGDEADYRLPDWTISEPVTENRSVFVARACHVSSLSEAKSAIAHLISNNRKVASATHNITAWRIKIASSSSGIEVPEPHRSANKREDRARAVGHSDPEVIIQDCDDDGETAAGGRLLHLMQLMDVWNVVVVVTRWYGGVKLGPDRFRIINNVARNALIRGDFVENQTSIGQEKSRANSKR